MIKTAIIGINGFGRVHFNDLMREVEKHRVTIRAAVIRPRHWGEPAVAKLRELGTEIFSDYHEMLARCARELDLCCIPTAIAQHLPMTCAALAAGVNVMVEKPVTPTYQEALEMQAAEKASGKFVAVGYQDIYQTHTRQLKELLLSGLLGRIKCLKCYVLWPRPQSYYQRNSWAGQLWGSGQEPILDAPFTNATAHFLNLLNFYAGNQLDRMAEIAQLQAVMLRCNPIPSCDSAGIKMTTCDGKTLLFLCSHAARENVDPVTIIQCEKGMVRYTLQGGTAFDLSGKPLWSFTAPDYVAGRQAVWNAVFERVTDPHAWICTIEQAAQTTRLGNAVFDAAPIYPVPENCQTTVKKDQDSQIITLGIDDVMARCFAEERLPNKVDYNFLPAPETLDLRNYAGFEGRQYK